MAKSPFEERADRFVQMDIRREFHQDYKKQVQLHRLARDLGIATPLVTTAVFINEASRFDYGEYVLGGAAIVASLAISVPAEIRRRRYVRKKRGMAEQVVELASNEPRMPIPKWAKEELDDSGL